MICGVSKELMNIPEHVREESPLNRLMARVAVGDVRALSRAISLVEDGGAMSGQIIQACASLQKHARRIGITGSAGAGKSTLADQMIRILRARGERVAVVAVDPTSPYTGGALLGDRIRMQGFTGDHGVYIRSMASRGALGGVAEMAAGACAVLEVAGFDTILVETVGVGQDEVSVCGLVDRTILVLVPGMGDDVQSLKAGVMEAADLFVINKCDLPGADKVEAELRGMQSLTGEARPILRAIAHTGAGVAELLDAVVAMGRRGRRAEVPVGPTLEHLGVAVRSIAAARTFYERLGLRVEREVAVEHEQVRAALLPLGKSMIELLEPTAEDSTIGRFLAKRGEGLHHIAIRVDELDAHFAAMQAAGVRLASDRVRVGAGGYRYFFVHPSSTGGVLIELVGG
jgi:LAO/AO transport system kinase